MGIGRRRPADHLIEPNRRPSELITPVPKPQRRARLRVDRYHPPGKKGVEFRAVAVMACDDEILPLQERIDAVSDDADLEDVYNTERHLLYVACPRAREYLLVTGVHPASEFLDDLTRTKRSSGGD